MAPFYKEIYNNVTNWTSSYPTCSSNYLHKISGSEYEKVLQSISQSLTEKVYKIDRVENPFLWGCYNLKKLEYTYLKIPYSVMELIHCTAECNVSSIITNNLDWRRSNRCKFGQGVSFSPDSLYANRFANRDIGSNRVFIICDVLVGRTVSGDYSTVFPVEPHDTSVGNCCKVYVKYNDHEFYPKYVVYYQD